MDTFEWTVQLTAGQERIIKLVRMAGVVFLFAGMAVSIDLDSIASTHGLEDDFARRLLRVQTHLSQ